MELESQLTQNNRQRFRCFTFLFRRRLFALLATRLVDLVDRKPTRGGRFAFFLVVNFVVRAWPLLSGLRPLDALVGDGLLFFNRVAAQSVMLEGEEEMDVEIDQIIFQVLFNLFIWGVAQDWTTYTHEAIFSLEIESKQGQRSPLRKPS